VFLLNDRAQRSVGYCGLDCSFCGIYQGRIKRSFENLQKVIVDYDFEKVALELADHNPAFQHYREFEKVLDGFVKVFTECPGCIARDRYPTCTVRECCQQHHHATCLECVEMDICEKLRTMAICLRRDNTLKMALNLSPTV